MTVRYTFEDLFGQFGDYSCILCGGYTCEIPTSSKTGPAKDHVDWHNAIRDQMSTELEKADTASAKSHNSALASKSLGGIAGVLLVFMFIFPDSWASVFVYLSLSLICGTLAVLASRAALRWKLVAIDRTMRGVQHWTAGRRGD